MSVSIGFSFFVSVRTSIKGRVKVIIRFNVVVVVVRDCYTVCCWGYRFYEVFYVMISQSVGQLLRLMCCVSVAFILLK